MRQVKQAIPLKQVRKLSQTWGALHIEAINDQLKNISQIEHTRHRSEVNFLVNLVCGLIAYCHKPKKPSVASDADQLNA
ncbi:gsl2128 [Gloeobacter violaceus PCC 7421]|uniref:Gsl2128 protein n=1 Tax=Gloeobacter violaceus (strain ATCC 29082 / PCC 7421) TaxID=251221 RepID=Q7NIQ5_GLOVI|nr:gsl2128 [Gloeobacter violaceus PCC 7421]